ncbi:MAG: type VII secretion protein EssC [Clostridia bacterium]|nr:type VII secretion protein EssC [Clostridia bacterium]
MYYISVLIGEAMHDFSVDNGRSQSQNLRLPQHLNNLRYDLVIPVRVLDGRLFMTPCRGYSWEDDNSREERELLDGSMFRMGTRTRHLIIRTALMPDRCSELRKYSLPVGKRITIGRKAEYDVSQDSPLLADYQGDLECRSAAQVVYVDRSAEGAYHNGRKVRQRQVQLQYGDVLVMGCGLRMVFLGDMLAVNEPVLMRHNRLSPAPARPLPQTGIPQAVDSVTSLTAYARAPRIMHPAQTRTVTIEPPLSKQPNNAMPLLLTLGPSATMVLPMLLSSLVSGRSVGAMVVMMGGSAALSVMWGFINARYRKSQGYMSEERRQELYRQYIAETEEELNGLVMTERSRLDEMHMGVKASLNLPRSRSHRLWERMVKHEDFGVVRLGRGEIDLPSAIRIPQDKLSMIDDDLRDEPGRLYETYRTIPDAPIVISLREESLVGVLSASDPAADQGVPRILSGMVLQLAASHSYHDLRIAVLADERHTSRWDWARWLPHVYADDSRSMRMIAFEPGAHADVISYLENVIKLRRERLSERNVQDDNAPMPLPHYVVFCTDYTILENQPLVRLLLQNPRMGMTIVMQGSSMEQLPKECNLILQANDRHGVIYGSKGEVRNLSYEWPELNEVNQFARDIAPIRVKDTTEDAAIPTYVSFLDICGVRQVEELDVWRFWNENHTYEGLQAVIGLKSGARPFVLDISDKAHGPHGLVAGTTGSGKSVMLQTYILSLALNYHPDEVQFVLIDYKGGGTTNVFRELPHVAGLVDNTDAQSTILRALKSLAGEVSRREKIFTRLGLTHINEYIREYGNDPDEPTLAHIIIVIDEFAQLKNEQEGFMKELVRIAAVGRTLGLHLILATQRPSSSVDEDITANTRFRICLRVASRSDSTSMLYSHPEAAYLRGMGRCYVMVGNDEIFEQVQTSYSGAEYDPRALTGAELPKVLDSVGRPVTIKKKRKNADGTEMPTQMKAIIDRICDVSQEHHVPAAHQLWLQPLEDTIYLENMMQQAGFTPFDGRWHHDLKDGLRIPYAMLDDVTSQRYLPVMLDLTAKHNCMVVGVAQSGKTSMLQTLAMSMALLYSPDQVNIHVFSLTSKTLSSLRELPHVGEVVFDPSAPETLNLLQMLVRMDEERKRIFSRVGTDSFMQYNQAADLSDEDEFEPMPAVVVLIDRLAQLVQNLEERYVRQLYRLFNEAASHGIYFVVSALNLSNDEISWRVAPVFSGVALRLPDQDSYKQVLGVSGASAAGMNFAVRHTPGRGMSVLTTDKVVEVCEIQTAIYGTTNDPNRAVMISQLGQEMQKAWNGQRTDVLLRLPERLTLSWMHELPQCDPRKLRTGVAALGIDRVAGVPVLRDLDAAPWLLEAGPKSGNCTAASRVLLESLLMQGAQVVAFGDKDAFTDLAQRWPEQVEVCNIANAAWINAAFLGCYSEEDSAEFGIPHVPYDRSLESRVAAERFLKRKQLAADTQAAEAFTDGLTPLVICVESLPALLQQVRSGLVHGKVSHYINAWCTGAILGLRVYMLVCGSVEELNMLMSSPALQALGERGCGVVSGCRLTDCNFWDKNRMSYEDKACVPQANEYMLVTPERVMRLLKPELE